MHLFEQHDCLLSQYYDFILYYHTTYINMLEYLILNNRFEAACKYAEQAQKNYKEELLNQFNKGKRVDFMRVFQLLRKEEKL